MRIVIRWWQPKAKREDSALGRFKAVLSAAAETKYYRPWLDAARLLGAGQRERLTTLPEALACVPRVDFGWYLHHEDEFQSRQKSDFQPALQHPCEPAPRTAILVEGFELKGNVRTYAPGDVEGLLKFGPECLAGPAETLLHVGRGIRRGRIALPTLRHSVVVFSDLRNGMLAEADRDALWSAFRVPVFEQLRGLSGELVAAECEAHNGLHLCAREAVMEFDPCRHRPELLYTSLVNPSRPAIRLATGWSPIVDEGVCACGTSHPRLMDLVAVERARPLTRAAAC